MSLLSQFLGVKEVKMKTPNQLMRWSDEDVQKLIENTHLSNAELAALLGRTVDSVNDKRRKIERQTGIGYQRKEPRCYT